MTLHKMDTKIDIGWLVEDINFLITNNRKPAALLLALCLIDAIANRAYPEIESDGDRFQKLILEYSSNQTVLFVYSKQKDTLLKVERILWEFVRNPMVHRGDDLTIAGEIRRATSIDWNPKAPSIKVNEGHPIFSGDFLLSYVIGVLNNAITGKQQRQANVTSLVASYAGDIKGVLTEYYHVLRTKELKNDNYDSDVVTTILSQETQHKLLRILQKIWNYCQQTKNLDKAKSDGMSVKHFSEAAEKLRKAGLNQQGMDYVQKIEAILC